MILNFIFPLVSCLIVFSANGVVPNREDESQLLYVTFEGFSYELLKKNKPWFSNFHNLKKVGVTTQGGGNFPTFFSDSIPSFYSSVTGLTIENHGMIADEFYDPNFNEYFSYLDPDFDTKWWAGEPIWITSAKNGRPSATVDSQVPNFTHPLYTSNRSSSLTPEERTQLSLDLLEQGKAFVSVRFRQPEDIIQRAGETFVVPYVMNKFVGWLLKEILSRNFKSLNVILMSDHGIAPISQSRVINIFDYIHPGSVRNFTARVILNLWPVDPNLTDEIYNNLTNAHPNMTVYRKNYLPERCNCQGSQRVAPIVVIANEGWIFSRPDDFPKNNGSAFKGYHGYDNQLPSMRSIFYAFGPDIDVGKKVAPFSVIHYYLLACRLLRIPPAKNQGSDSVIWPIFRRRLKDAILLRCNQFRFQEGCNQFAAENNLIREVD